MPSEMVVAGYLAVLGFLSAADGPPSWLLWLVWGVFLAATPFYIWLVKPEKEEKRRWWQIWIFSPVSFFIWSLTAGGAWASVSWAGLAGGVLVILFSAVIFPLVSMGIAKATS